MDFAKVGTWADKQHIYAVVETPRGSYAKLEFDPKLRAFTLSKPLLAEVIAGGSLTGCTAMVASYAGYPRDLECPLR